MLTTNSTTTESSNLHSQQQQHQETNTTSTKPSQSQVTFNLNPKSPLEGIETSHQQQNNNSNFLVYTPSDLSGPNSNQHLMMRRDRSLDRCTMTESYFDPDTGFTSRRSYLNTSNVSSSQLSTPQQPNFPAYVNSTLYLSNNVQQQQSYKAPSTRQHHRSNSILTNPNLGSTSNTASFNPLGAFINRDSGIDSGGVGVNSNGVYTGLRSSRALSSSTNFTSIGFLGRDSSTNSVNLPNESNSSVQNNSNTQQVAFSFLISNNFIENIFQEMYFFY